MEACGVTKRPKDLFGHPVRPPREDAIHAAIVEFLCLAAHPRTLFFHPANGSLVKPSARMYFARLGVFPGVADLVLVLPDKSVAFLEVKSELGQLSEAQKAFQARCAVLGLKYSICRSTSEAEDILASWGALRGRVTSSDTRQEQAA
jgi:VRR-NUC domain